MGKRERSEKKPCIYIQKCCLEFQLEMRVVEGGGEKNFLFQNFLFLCFFGTGLFKNRPGVGMALASFFFFLFLCFCCNLEEADGR